MAIRPRARGNAGAVLSIALTLTIALTLAVKLWPDDGDTVIARQTETQPPEAALGPTPSPDPLSVAVVRLPPPPPPKLAVTATAAPAAKPPPPKPPTPDPPKSTPAPMVVTPLKPTPFRPEPRPVAVETPVQPSLQPADRSPDQSADRNPPPEPVKIDRTVVAEGRALLRLLELGQGPAIEIAWPSGAAARSRLFGYLRGCLGMRVALMDSENRFYLASGPAGVASELNLDRFSGFMRYPAGRLSRAEKRRVAQIRARHGKTRATAIRLFPRSVDAALLGGLSIAVGKSYATARNIRARYRQDGGGLYITDIRVGARAVAGRVLLSNRRCSNSGV